MDESLQCVAECCVTEKANPLNGSAGHKGATCCNALQRIATHFKALHHIATQYNALQYIATQYYKMH